MSAPAFGHDPAAAQVLLNELGLNQVDENGWRVAPDGTVFTLPIEYDHNLVDFERIAGKLAGDLGKIGLKTEVLGIDPLVLQGRARGNQLRGSLGTLGYPLWEVNCKVTICPLIDGAACGASGMIRTQKKARHRRRACSG